MNEYFLNKQQQYGSDCDFSEPANMVLALGARNGIKEVFYKFIPFTKIRRSDNRSIINFDVDTRIRPYVSPFSGGIAYTVISRKENITIQHPEDRYLYPPDLKHSLRWTLLEVHVGNDPGNGPFVGVILKREFLNKEFEDDWEYIQWNRAEECDPIYYGAFPKGFNNIDPEYIKLHEQTMKFAQDSVRYECCTGVRCCVRLGCEMVRCGDDIACHIKEKCPNVDNYYENILEQWMKKQIRVYDQLLVKVKNPLQQLVDIVLLKAFGVFIKDIMSIDRSPDTKTFMIIWARCKAQGMSDFEFVDSWKIQQAREDYLKKAIEASAKAEYKWAVILKKRNNPEKKPSREELKRKIREKRTYHRK